MTEPNKAGSFSSGFIFSKKFTNNNSNFCLDGVYYILYIYAYSMGIVLQKYIGEDGFLIPEATGCS